MGCRIIGCAKALPQLTVTNDELSEIVDTSDEWIVTRTGIHERRIAIDETNTSLAAQAGREALAAAGMDPASVDLLICMTISPDAVVPSQAALVRAAMGLENAVAFDLNAACTGCIYGLEVASSMIEASVMASRDTAGSHKRNTLRRALVIGAERLSRIVDWTDRATCVLFGDGAGAVALEWQEGASGILGSFLKNTDDDELVLTVDSLYDLSTFPFAEDAAQESVGQVMGVAPAGGAEESAALAPVVPYIAMHGQKVFKFATAAIVEAAQEACARAGVALEDLACIVPHQANERIIRYAAKKLGVPLEHFQVSIGGTGNTSASSVLMALADAYGEGRIQPGDKVLLVGFGGGLTSGALVFEA